jgi:EpsI family protein
MSSLHESAISEPPQAAPAPWARLALAGALLVMLWHAHREALDAMVGLWSRSPMYSYAYTVPVISLWLAWSRRDALAGLRPRTSLAAAIPVLAFGAALLIAGRLGAVQVLEQLAFLGSFVGVLLVVFGAAYVRAMWAAIAYLLLMIPIWDGFTEPLHPRFQQQSAAIGVWLLQEVGIPAYRERNVVALPNITLEVARACSGVNYLIAVIALGLPLAYLNLRGVWRRALLVGGAVLVAALANGLRVALIGVLAYLEIGSPLHGPMHMLHGLFVAAIGYVVLFAGLYVLKPRDSEPIAAPAATTWAHLDAIRVAPVAVLLVFFMALGAIAAPAATSSGVLRKPLDRLPRALGEWRAAPGPAESEFQQAWQGSDAHVLRRYRTGDGRTLDIFVAYFGTQRQDRELASYLSADLHRRAALVEVPLVDGGSLPANFVAAAAGGQPSALFWYELGERVETRPYATKLRTLWRALSSGRSDGAVVVISTPGGSGAATRQNMEEFAALAYAALGDSFPRATPSPGSTISAS